MFSFDSIIRDIQTGDATIACRPLRDARVDEVFLTGTWLTQSATYVPEWSRLEEQLLLAAGFTGRPYRFHVFEIAWRDGHTLAFEFGVPDVRVGCKCIECPLATGMVRILRDGEYSDVRDGTTIGDFFAFTVGGNPVEHTIRVNSQPVPASYVLRDDDRVYIRSNLL